MSVVVSALFLKVKGQTTRQRMMHSRVMLEEGKHQPLSSHLIHKVLFITH